MRTDRVRAEFDRLGEPLPQPWAVPADANIPASLVRVVGSIACVSVEISTVVELHGWRRATQGATVV